MRKMKLLFAGAVCLLGCKPNPTVELKSMHDKSLTSNWWRHNKQYVDSCALEESGVSSLILSYDYEYKLRSNLLKELIQEKGSEFQVYRITFSEHSTVLSTFYSVLVWFDDEDLGLSYSFDQETGKFEKGPSASRLDDSLFKEPELGCCYKYDQSTIAGCSFRSVFEGRADGKFQLVDFCMRYYQY